MPKVKCPTCYRLQYRYKGALLRGDKEKVGQLQHQRQFHSNIFHLIPRKVMEEINGKD